LFEVVGGSVAYSRRVDAVGAGCRAAHRFAPQQILSIVSLSLFRSALIL